MDAIKAADLEARLVGTSIESWTIEKLIGFGKSAAVFRAASLAGSVAIKVFDDELIERYGDAAQFSRIERERSLIGESHPNLVRILGGGVDAQTRNHYIIMDFLDGPNLKSALPHIAASSITHFIAHLARAARFLEERGFCHRDIKPENIVLTNDLSHLVLLDLGVIRPLIGSDLTDAEGINPFIGTLQYSSPEFLLRDEEDSPEGWRSLTFYQIGAVLHDLIMRKPIFEEFAQPYAKLVNAVQHSTPQIQNSAVPFRLVDLARSCLLKDWRTRLSFVSWDRFEEPDRIEQVGSAKQRVTNRGALAQARAGEKGNDSEPDTIILARFSQEVLGFLSTTVRSLRSANPLLPPLRVRQNAPDASSLTVEFPCATDLDLARGLSVIVNLRVADANARVIIVQLGGCTGAVGPEELPEDVFEPVFRGVYDTLALERAFEEGLYSLIDAAQRLQDDAELDTTSWLRISERTR